MHWARHCAACGGTGLEISEGRSYRCPDCGFCYFHNVASAVCAILRRGSRVAFVTRARDPGRGLLDLPGGFVDPDETLEAAIAREVKEELGLILPTGRYLFSACNEYHYAGVNYRTLDAYFEFTMPAAEPVLDGVEIAALHWLEPAEVRPADLAFVSLRTALSRLQGGGNAS